METRQTKQTYTFGTWNVRGLKEKKTETFAEIQRENVDVVVLTETKLKNIGEEDYGSYIYLHSGVVSGVPRAGISILVKKDLREKLKWEAISERLITAQLKICGQSISIIGVYYVDDSARSDAKIKFESKLKSVLESCRTTDELIILGDFNARVGNETEGLVVGQFGEREVNDNGKRLRNLCERYGLKIQDTFFEHEDRHKYTWYRSRPSQKTQIDHCITKQSTTLLVNDVVACRWLDCGSDHVFLKATLSFLIETVEEVLDNPNILEMTKYRTYLLFSKDIQTRYKEFLESRIGGLKVPSTVDVMYKHLKQCIHDAAFHVLGVENESIDGEFLWDDELRRLKAPNMKPNCDSNEDNLSLKLKGLDLKKVKNEVWENVCHSVKQASKRERLNIARNILEEFRSSCVRKRSMTQSVENYCKIICRESELRCFDFIAPRWKSLGNENLQDLNEVTVFEVSKVLEEMEDTYFPSPGGMTIKLLRYSGPKTLQLLTDMIQKIFNGYEIPSEINETYLIPVLNTISRRGTKINYSLHTVMRVMGEILKHRLENCIMFTTDKQRELKEQNYMEAIFVLRQLLQKNAELQNGPLHIAVVDYERSYNEMRLEPLIEVLDKTVENKWLIEVVKNLYNVNSYRVVTSNIYSKRYYTVDGLRSGCSLSPTLFKRYIQESILKWERKNESRHFGITIELEEMHSLFFNDSHLFIASDNKDNFCEMIRDFKRLFKNIHLKMHFTYLGPNDFEIGTKQKVTVKAEDSICLQNFVLELEGRNGKEILERTLETKHVIALLHPVARDEMISMKNKKKIFKSIIRCFLTLGCETWTLTNDLKLSLESVEISFWKWCCEDYPKVFTKQQIYEKMNVTHPISELIMIKKSAWYARIMQIDSVRLARGILNWTPEGKRRCGFPRKRWDNGLEEFLKTFQLENAIEGKIG